MLLRRFTWCSCSSTRYKFNWLKLCFDDWLITCSRSVDKGLPDTCEDKMWLWLRKSVLTSVGIFGSQHSFFALTQIVFDHGMLMRHWRGLISNTHEYIFVAEFRFWCHSSGKNTAWIYRHQSLHTVNYVMYLL